MVGSALDGLYLDFNIPLGLANILFDVIGATQGDVNTPQVVVPTTPNRMWVSQPRPSTDSTTEVIQINFKLPLSVSEVGWDALRVSSRTEVWYLDRQNNWRQVRDDGYNPVVLTLSSASVTSWYTAHFFCYQIVAKAIQFRVTRVPDPLRGAIPYSVGIRNGLIRRNIYARTDGTQGIEPIQDALGNTITSYIKDWDAVKAVDNDSATFWRSAPLPDPMAVCNLYLDVRAADGSPQLIDSLYIDPIYSGQNLNIYYSNDDTTGTLRLSPISAVPANDENTKWAQGTGRWDIADEGDNSDYQFKFSWGPLVEKDAWFGVEWAPDFAPTVSDAVQTVTVTGSPSSGTFTLTYDGETTTPISYNSSAINVQNALTALASIGVDDVLVGGPNGGPWTVTFRNALGGEAIDEMTYSTSFTGGTAPDLTVETTTVGGVGGGPPENPILLNVTPLSTAGVNAVQTLSFTGGLPTDGVFTLTFNGHETGDLDYDCTADDIQTALEALPNIGDGDVAVTGVSGDGKAPWAIMFRNNLGERPISNLVVDASLLEGDGPDLNMRVVTSTPGSVEVTTAVTGQYTPKLYYDVGAGQIVLQLTDGVSPLAYACSISPLFAQYQPLRIVAGWEYGDSPGVYLKVATRNGVELGSVTYSVPSLPAMMSFDGLVGFEDFRGLFTAHVIKLEHYSATSDAFLANPQVYVSPDPVQPDSSGNTPSTTLDNAIYAAAWVSQEHGTGGSHETNFQSKMWTPLWADYIVQKGKLFFPQQTNAKYLCLEFSKLTEEPYPVYDSGIQVSYQTFPISVTSTTTQRNPGLLGIANGLLSLGADVLLTGIGTVNWLNPQTINNAVNSIFGQTTTPALVTTGSGSVTTLPNTTDLDWYEQTRSEVSTSWIYKRNPLSVPTLASNLITVTSSSDPLQVIESTAHAIGTAVANAFAPTMNFVSNLATLPLQGADWWVFPGAALRLPATVMNGLTAVSQTVLGRPDSVTRYRFDTTSVHRYETKTVNRDAAVAYFAGIAEVQPYVTTYIVGQDATSFEFNQYDPSQWTFTNINKLDDGPITTAGHVYEILNQAFDNNLDYWTEEQGNWSQDGTLGHWHMGTATVEADGTDKVLLSNIVPVTTGANLESNTWVKWADFIATSGSEAIQLQARFYNNGVFISSQHVGLTYSPWDEDTPEIAGNHWDQIVASEGTSNLFVVPSGVNQMRLALVVTEDATAGRVWFDTVTLGTSDTVLGIAFKDFQTSSTFAKLRCEFNDSGVVRSDSMWGREDPNNTNISNTSLAYYTSTIPDVVPAGMWGDTFATWGDPVIAWGEPRAVVAINVDPNRIYDNKRVLHFTRAAGAGEAGVKIRQSTHFIANGLFRLGAVFFKPVANNNQMTIQLRRVSDGVYIYQETFTPVAGYWYEHVTDFIEIPDSDDQIYTVELVLTGDQADELYLNDLYTELAHIRYFVRLGGSGEFLHDVTALAYANTAIVSCTEPVNSFTVQATILSPSAFCYSAKLTPNYLK